MSIEQIASEIGSASRKAKPVVVGVEGFGGSGKTTFAEKLANTLGNAYIIGLDDFIIKEKLTAPSWDSGVFDHNRLERQVLQPSRQGGPIAYQRLHWATDTLSQPITVPDADYLIVEGISAYHPSVEQYYDFKIWVDTPLPVAQERGHARDGANENAQYWELWAQNDLAYQQQYHPERRADFVYPNV